MPPISRSAQLQARCEAQRHLLATQVTAIAQRLQGTDAVLGSVRKVLSSSTVLAGSLALLLTAGRSGWGSTLSRGVALFTTARRVYRAFKRH
jgi:hypothetical protein